MNRASRSRSRLSASVAPECERESGCQAVSPRTRPLAAAFALLAALLVCAVAARQATAADAATGRIANGLLQLGFDARDGTLREFVDLKAGHNHVGNTAGAIWEIEFA